MYNIDHRPDGYCLLYYVLDDFIDYGDPYVLAHQLIPYCIRSAEEEYDIIEFNNTIDSSYTFSQLRKQNITSQLLLSWSASIELAEEYQIFLNNKSDSLWLIENETLFYNCTQPWFGPHCQFAFGILTSSSLADTIARKFGFIQSKLTYDFNVTCYMHLNCTTSWMCLDWREICDRKVDCLDGSDELNCWQLEINECEKDEYRCYNGQCIPLDFFHDAVINPDCLDRTDEPTEVYSTSCPSDPAFRCEEHSCRPGKKEFPCGDGKCTTEMEYQCPNGRGNLLFDNPCLIAMACVLQINYQIGVDDLTYNLWCTVLCQKNRCGEDNCSIFYEFPSIPILFGHVRFIFNREKISLSDVNIPIPIYVCYHKEICEDFLPDTFYFNNMSCNYLSDIGLKDMNQYKRWLTFLFDVKQRFRGCLVAPNERHYCNHSTMYQCKNSTKCISKHRLVDGIRDCPFDDDETFNESCSLSDVHNRFTCSVGEKKKCFASLIIKDEKKDCENGEDEYNTNSNYEHGSIHVDFRLICDGFEEMMPVLIDGRNETDETNCEYWRCNNTYTRCDGFWSCGNGADEINCPPSTCPMFEHTCILPNDTSKLSCLEINRVGDGNVDCLGATDEQRDCRIVHAKFFQYRFHCLNDKRCIENLDLCDGEKKCPSDDDEVFCEPRALPVKSLCSDDLFDRTEVESFLCNFTRLTLRPKIIYHALRNMAIYPAQKLIDFSPSIIPVVKENKLIQSNVLVYTDDEQAWICNRGLAIYIRTNMSESNLYCLCPPSYYEDRCQYQNQRVSLSIQVRVVTDWRSTFTFVIMLIDHMQNIESHDYIEYLPVRDCNVKYNVYLLYSTRPKNALKNYSIRIDAFNKLTLTYKSSWIYPVRFPFLPVYRLSIQLKVPFTNVEAIRKCPLPCIHGSCVLYVNDQSSIICRCEPGWSGAQCDIEYIQTCASNALSIDKTICLCPVGQYGPRCHLSQSLYYSDSCFNGGQYVVTDERYSSTRLSKFQCVCSEEYFGDQCEYRRTRIDISFHQKISIPQSLFVHFIFVQDDIKPIRTSTMQKIAFDQNSVLIYTSNVFNVAFAEMLDHYYLIILQEQDIISANITTQINPSHRCVSIEELFGQTFANQYILKRVKYYHVPCYKQLDLFCFYDDRYFCLCDLDRRINCFEFDHNMTYDCFGYNMCENGGQCFQNDPKCPTSSACVCPECYYGSRCQFSAKGSTLSLDAILGYSILLDTPINRQSIVVKVAITLTTIIFVFGLFGSLFLFATFYTKKTCDVGCGLYLRASSIVSMITISVLIIKFWLLLASQMNSFKNRSLIYAHCVSLDFFLRLLLSGGDWLSACIAIERAVTVSIGVKFNKAKSKQLAKWMIFLVFIITSCTHIHDPIHRYLIDDEAEHRTWCVVKYSSPLQTFDWIVNILHFSIPFGINCISALIIITATARIRSNIRKGQSYKEHLRIQFREYKHLLISPCILVLLALPRLIISFLSGCMKSARNPWLYLIGYFISFVPTVMTFVVFVLPSEMYRKAFCDSMKGFWS